MVFKRFFVPIVSSVLFVSGCEQPHNLNSDLTAVLDDDDRVVLDDESRYAGVGVLFTPSGTCTASAIARDKLLTAAHCLGKITGNRLSNQEVYFFALKKEEYRSAITGVAEIDRSADTAILTLKTPSPAVMEIGTNGGGYDGREIVSLVQYDPNLDEIVSSQCPMPAANENAFYGTIHSLHSCDSGKGSSGAPLILGNRLIGIHHGYDLTSKRNIASFLPNRAPKQTPSGAFNLEEASWDPEVQCGTDCYRHCRRKVLGNWVPNPVCEAACVVERESNCSKEVKVCGIGFTVSALMHAACITATSSIPVACTGMAAPTAGSSCAVSVGTAAGICGVSVGTLRAAAIACMATALDIDASDIKLEW